MSHGMKMVRTIILSMLLVISASSVAQVHDFCSFAGVWNSQGKNALTIHISDNQPQCILRGETTNDIAVANNKIYIDFIVGKKTNGCDTKKHHLLCIGSIEKDSKTLRLTLRRINEINSKWRTEFKPEGKDTVIIFHKKRDVPCKNKVTLKRIDIKDTSSYAFKKLTYGNFYFYKQNASLEEQRQVVARCFEDWCNFFREANDSIVLPEESRLLLASFDYYFSTSNDCIYICDVRDSAIDWYSLLRRYYFESNDSLEIHKALHLLADLQYRFAIIHASISKLDSNLITGWAYYQLFQLKNSKAYAQEALKYLPQNEEYYAVRADAKLFLIKDGFNSRDGVDIWFSYFAFLSDVINKYENRKSLTDIDSINLQAALNLRSWWFLTWMRDTLSGIDDLERAITVSTNPQWDSVFRIRLSDLYCLQAFSFEPNMKNVLPTGKAQEYYMKSIEHFEKAHVRDITTLDSSAILPLYAYWRLNKDTVKLNICNGIIADYCYKNPDRMSHMDSNVYRTTKILLEREAFDSLFAFYDTIRNRFVFDESILADYLTGLIRAGYSFDDVKKVGERLFRTMDKEGKAHSARVRMLMGDFDGLFMDLLNNEKIFDSIYDITGESISHNIIAMMEGERLGYELAYQKCFSWATEGIDSSTMLCYSGKYKLKHAEEINNEKIKKDLKSSAEKDFRKVIADERTQRTKFNTPYAYYWLGKEDSARIWTEKLLQGDDTLDAYGVAADIYSLLGDYQLARNYIDGYVKYIDSAYEKDVRLILRGLLKYGDNLTPLSEYIDTICVQHDRDESVDDKKRISFDTTVITLDCFFKKGGSVYLPCKIGPVTDTMLFDPGAKYLQITKKFACELMDKDLKAINYIGTDTLTSSNNDTFIQEMVILDSITLGEKTLYNVMATIAEDPNAPMLLGMSVLGSFDIELSIRKSKITLKYITEKLKNNQPSKQ